MSGDQQGRPANPNELFRGMECQKRMDFRKVVFFFLYVGFFKIKFKKNKFFLCGVIL